MNKRVREIIKMHLDTGLIELHTPITIMDLSAGEEVAACFTNRQMMKYLEREVYGYRINDRHGLQIVIKRQKNKTTLQVEEWLKENSGHDCFQTIVRRSVVAEKSTIAHVPLPKFSKGCIASQDYRAVTYELLRDLEGARDE